MKDDCVAELRSVGLLGYKCRHGALFDVLIAIALHVGYLTHRKSVLFRRIYQFSSPQRADVPESYPASSQVLTLFRTWLQEGRCSTATCPYNRCSDA